MPQEDRHFVERLTGVFAEDAYRFSMGPFALGALLGALGWESAAWLGFLLGAFVLFFFRNPDRLIPGDESTVVSPADGKVIDVSEVETEDGEKALRIGIFLSIFNVHVNRVPVAGKVVAIERSGDAYLAAFNPEAERRNVRLDMTLETAGGTRIRVSQITGLIARRIVCQPRVGEQLRRGDRYGLIRFGSRTDVVLPADAEVSVVRGQGVRGGSTAIARLAPGAVA